MYKDEGTNADVDDNDDAMMKIRFMMMKKRKLMMKT